jgi:hypothetical protein
MRKDKPQSPNSKEISSSNNQLYALRVLGFGYWSFSGAWVLGFGAFDRSACGC